MKQLALPVFHQPPHRLNCAQSVLHDWREVTGNQSIVVAEMKPFGGGRAPGGVCGALHAACVIATACAGRFKADFVARMGSHICKKIRSAKVHACDACVTYSAELLEFQSEQKQVDK